VEVGFWFFTARYEFTVLEWPALHEETWPIIPGKCMGGIHGPWPPTNELATMVAFTRAPMVNFGSTNQASGSNTPDQPCTFECPPNQAMTKVGSHWIHYYGDRQWSYTCNGIINKRNASQGVDPVGLNSATDRWSNHWSPWDGHQLQECGDNEVMTGLRSEHSNHREDRRFKIRCTQINSGSIMDFGWKPSGSNNWANDWRENGDWFCHDGTAMIGMESIHNNDQRDRRFKFKCGRPDLPAVEGP